MKTVTGDENFFYPIFFLVIYSLAFVTALSLLPENFNKEYSIILAEPFLFADSILKTVNNLNTLFLVPALILCLAYSQKSTLLKIAFSLGSIPCIFSDNVIAKVGYKSIFVLNLLVLIVGIVLIIKYLNNTLGLYKAALKEKNR